MTEPRERVPLDADLTLREVAELAASRFYEDHNTDFSELEVGLLGPNNEMVAVHIELRCRTIKSFGELLPASVIPKRP